MDCEEATGLGTAMLSFVGNGTYRSLEEARKNMVRLRSRAVCDNGAAERYQAVYSHYLEMHDSFNGV